VQSLFVTPENQEAISASAFFRCGIGLVGPDKARATSVPPVRQPRGSQNPKSARKITTRRQPPRL